MIVYGNVDRDKKFEIWAKLNRINDDNLPTDCNGNQNEKGKESKRATNEDPFPVKETNDQLEKEDCENKVVMEHWCERIRICNDDGKSLWASCDPYGDECNGGSSKKRIGDVSSYWTSTNDCQRCELPWVDRLSFNDWVKIKYGKVDYLTKEKIWQEHTRSMDKEEQEDSDEDLDEACEESPSEDRNHQILNLIEDKLEDSWYKGSELDDDDLNEIVKYLDLQGYDEFTNLDDEAYKQRRCKLLRIPYKKPPPIHAETFEVIRYSIGRDEKFTKIVSQERKEFSRTSANVAWIRHNLMKEMDGLGQVRRPPT